MQALRSAENACKRLNRDTDNIIDRLLHSQAHARRLSMKAKLPRARLLRFEPLFHDAEPDTARRAILGDLLEEIIMRVKEKREARREFIDVEALANSVLDIFNAIAQRKREFLRSSGTGLTDVITGDRNAVPSRHLFGAKLKG